MVKISFTGDLLCYPNMTERFGKDYSVLFERATKLKACDYLVGNLETPIAGEEMKYTFERYCFNTPVGYVRAMKKAGFDLVTLANNHCMDRGEAGILKTLENFQSEGLETIGLYASEEARAKPFVKEFDGVKVAFVNYTYGTNAFAHHRFLEHRYMVNLFQPEETKKGSVHLLPENEVIAQDVERIYGKKTDEYACVEPYLQRLQQDLVQAKKVADFVVMVMHSGGQYNKEVDPYTRLLAEKIKEFGADIIVGHHPHIIQESEYKDDYLTIFSLGNFMDSPSVVGEKEIDFRYSAVFHLTLSKENGKIVAKKEFSLYKVVEDEKSLYVVDAYDLYRRQKTEALRAEILYFANRFAGEERYDGVKEVYEL